MITHLSPPDNSPHGPTIKDITVLYTNADQFFNKINDLEMLRPVSLTSTVVKVMESIIKTNVLEHLTSNNLLTCHQFGF